MQPDYRVYGPGGRPMNVWVDQNHVQKGHDCTIFFDGSCRPNPGTGRVGCLLLIDGGEVSVLRLAMKSFFWGLLLFSFTLSCRYVVRRYVKESKQAEMTAALGESTSNVAEYMALIRSLQQLLVPPLDQYKIKKMTVRGDSKLVINQVFGNWRVDEPRLRPLHSVCLGLLRRCKAASVEGLHIPREKNRVADALSQQRDLQVPRSQSAIYYPNLGNFVTCVIGGCSVLASHDYMTSSSDGVASIDAAFLFSLPGGPQILQELQESTFHVMTGKSTMTVIGFTLRPIKFSVEQRAGGRIHARHDLNEKMLVVDNLPVPVHVHWPLKGSFAGGPGVDDPRFSRDALKEPYCSHSYWAADDVVFLPFLGQHARGYDDDDGSDSDEYTKYYR